MVSTVPPRPDDSPVWKDLLQVRQTYLAGRKVLIKNGENVLFWLDCWLDDQPLCIKFPTLFELNDFKYISVDDFVKKMVSSLLEDGFLLSYSLSGSC